MIEGQIIYYIEEGHIYSGKAIHLQNREDGFTFQIEGYGACEGPWLISSEQVGRTVFLSEEEAQKQKQFL